MTKRNALNFSLSVSLLICMNACTDDVPTDESEVGDGDGDGDGAAPCPPSDELLAENTCEQLETDYTPSTPDDDTWPACISDGGTYELVADPPGSIARVEAFETIADQLWRREDAPRVDDFIAARTTYEIDQGLSSRVDRREDLHYPAIPEAEWDGGLDPDKQCSNADNAINHPDRCAGPSQIRPLVNQAFVDGIEDVGDPNLHAARIEAGLLWFLYISVYKEAFTCTAAAKDCDSAWAYYTGGAQVDGDLLGLARAVAQFSDSAHQRIFDGVLAARCFRDLYPSEDFPTYDELPPDGQAQFELAWDQLDDALHRGYAVVLRQHLLAQDSCGGASDANWEFSRITGDVLDHEARERDAAAADELAAIWALDEPIPDDITRAVELLELLFPCP